jgi:GDP-L-fucose synthase
MSEFWKNKKVLCTGSFGFVGNHLCARLEELGADIDSPKSNMFDLRNNDAVRHMFNHYDGVEIVFNLAANVGGIGYNQAHPYSLYFDNAQINLNMIDESIKRKIKKFVQLGTVCAYPKFTSVPFDERTLWDGYPEETNAPYGLAKRNALVQLQAARQEFGFNGIYLLPTNLYGPHDHFEPERSHVIPALIKKFVEAKEQNLESVEIWGSGNASRDFLYIDDAIEGIILAAEKWDSPEPVNLGSGDEIRIGTLVQIIKELIDYKGKINYNVSKPDGQPRRCLRTWRAKEFGWKPKIGLREGLQRTIDWYKNKT